MDLTVDASAAETQILATLYALETRPEEWWGPPPHRTTRRRLREEARRFWGDELASEEAWRAAVEDLRRRSWLRLQDGQLVLTEDGSGPARRRRSQVRRRRFDEIFEQAERSDAYLAFCRRTAGLDLRSFSPLDGGQLEAVLRALGLTPGDRCLDAGCGAGHVTEEVARRTGATLFGVDQAPTAIRMAQQRTGDASRLRFRPWDFEHGGDLPASSDWPTRFNAVLAVDSLAFVDDLPAVLGRLVDALAPGGRLVALTLEVCATPSSAPTAAALEGMGLGFEQHDLGELAMPVLRARAFAARALGPRFRREGHALLARVLAQEAERLAPLLGSERLRRFLYRAIA